MFHNDWILFRLAQERERDLVRQLEYDRRVRLARSSRRQRGRFDKMFLRLGQLLVAWGENLQARHNVLVSETSRHTMVAGSHSQARSR